MNQIEEAVNRDNPMLRTIENLFLTHKLVLFGRIDRVSEQQSNQVLAFLEDFYNEESIDYPSLAPKLHDEVAIWSSKILFHSAQLVMYREHKAEQERKNRQNLLLCRRLSSDALKAAT